MGAISCWLLAFSFQHKRKEKSVTQRFRETEAQGGKGDSWSAIRKGEKRDIGVRWRGLLRLFLLVGVGGFVAAACRHLIYFLVDGGKRMVEVGVCMIWGFSLIWPDVLYGFSVLEKGVLEVIICSRFFGGRG